MPSILIVDDERGVVELLRNRLQAVGYTVHVAFDGQQGLEAARTQKPDLIILDIMMPQMDGYSFVQEMRLDPHLIHTPIIVTTAKTHLQDLFKESGVRHYLVKPFDAETLMRAVQDVFEK